MSDKTITALARKTMKALGVALLGAAAVVAWFAAVFLLAHTMARTLGFGFGGAVLSIVGWIAFWAILLAQALHMGGKTNG